MHPQEATSIITHAGRLAFIVPPCIINPELVFSICQRPSWGTRRHCSTKVLRPRLGARERDSEM